MVTLITLMSCSQPMTTEAVGPSAIRVLTRASLDLRGVRPSAEEARSVLTDPATLDALVAEFVADERFGANVAGAWTGVYRTRSAISDLDDLDLAMEDEGTYIASVGEEPLRLLAYIADNDRPYTDVVRADYTVVDEVLAERYPVDYPAGETGWQVARYTDGRPPAGVLSTAGFWWRYTSTFNNANRGRANQVSRIFLCNDYLDRTVEFPTDLDLTDEAAVLNAVRTQEGCVSCHVTLDPLGAYMWGHYREFSNDPVDLSHYYPDRERYWTEFGVSPAYFGQPGNDMEDLGLQMAADPRLIQCVTQQAWELLLQRKATLDDTSALNTHREALIAGGVTFRALYRSILADPAYRVTEEQDPEKVPWKMLSADQFASVVEDLTGYRMVIGGHDVIREDYYGMRTMAAGAGVDVGTAAPSPTMIEVEARIAEAAASHVVTADASSEAPRLFTEIALTEVPAEGSEARVAQIQRLYLRVLGQDVAEQSEEVADAVSLWNDLYAADGDPQLAWAGVLTALMRDPDFLYY
ncbi:MAG: hypothetical protein Q8P18_26755 [Pseudomonadota bacterium]|nr:hypothetical protein [Pseudomonadota bacterium]